MALPRLVPLVTWLRVSRGCSGPRWACGQWSRWRRRLVLRVHFFVVGSTATGPRTIGTVSVSARLHGVAHYRSQVLLRAHGHLHYMCTSFARWAGWATCCDTHRRQVSSLSKSALHHLQMEFQRFETWVAHYYVRAF